MTVLAAYRKAEANLAAAKPSCHLPWWLVAGVGRIETGHAFGGRVDANGNTRGRIMGPLLDGSSPGTAVIRDTDGGKWDGDATFDRGIGPMGFLPGSWTEWGKDGNGDGVADPNNVFDAATAAGYVLCSVGDLSNPATMAKALLRYNHSASYVNIVLTWAAAYRDGVTPTADSTGSVPAPAKPSATPPPASTPPPSSPTPPPASTPPPPPPPSTTTTTTRPPTTTTTVPPTTTTTTSDHDDDVASDHDDDGPADHDGLTSGSRRAEASSRCVGHPSRRGRGFRRLLIESGFEPGFLGARLRPTSPPMWVVTRRSRSLTDRAPARIPVHRAPPAGA